MQARINCKMARPRQTSQEKRKQQGVRKKASPTTEKLQYLLSDDLIARRKLCRVWLNPSRCTEAQLRYSVWIYLFFAKYPTVSESLHPSVFLMCVQPLGYVSDVGCKRTDSLVLQMFEVHSLARRPQQKSDETPRSVSTDRKLYTSQALVKDFFILSSKFTVPSTATAPKLWRNTARATMCCDYCV